MFQLSHDFPNRRRSFEDVSQLLLPSSTSNSTPKPLQAALVTLAGDENPTETSKVKLIHAGRWERAFASCYGYVTESIARRNATSLLFLGCTRVRCNHCARAKRKDAVSRQCCLPQHPRSACWRSKSFLARKRKRCGSPKEPFSHKTIEALDCAVLSIRREHVVAAYLTRYSIQ